MRAAKLKRDVLVNLVLSLFITVGVMIVIRSAGLALAPAALGVFLLSRRTADPVSNFLQLGLSQTLRRYISMNEDRATQLLYLFTAIGLFSIVSSLFLYLLHIYRPFIRMAVFADTAVSDGLVFWLGVFIVGMVLHYITSSVLLAYRRIVAAGIVELLNTSVWLLLAISIFREEITVERLFQFQSIALFLLCGLLILTVILAVSRSTRGPFPWHRSGHVLRETFSYGLSRGVIPSLEMLFYLIGPWLIRDSVEESGYLIISFTLLNLGRLYVQPISIIVGLSIAKMVGERDVETLKTSISLLIGLFLYSGLLIFAVVHPWLREILELWLGDETLAGHVYRFASVLLIVMPAATLFQGLKEPIEMLWKVPCNLFTLMGSMAVLLFTYGILQGQIPGASSVLYAYLAAFLVSSIVTLFWIRNYAQPVQYYGVVRLIFVILSVWSVNMIAADLLADYSFLARLFGAVGIGGVSILLGILLLMIGHRSAFVVDATRLLGPNLRFG